MAGELGVGVVEGSPDTGLDVKDVPAGTPQGSDDAGADKGDQAEGSQDSSDSGSASGQDGRQRGKSVFSQMRELKSQLRDQRGYWESEVGQLKRQLEEFRAQIGRGSPVEKRSKWSWDAPDQYLDERLNQLEQNLEQKFEQTQAQREEMSVRQQEITEAAKFIRSQKGMTEDDIQDIRDILKSNPQLENLAPMDQAEFALFKWQKERGIGDKTAQKNRASSVTGSGTQGTGPKMWTESEIEKEMAKFPQNVALWTPEVKTRFEKIDNEIRLAYREKRVTK